MQDDCDESLPVAGCGTIIANPSPVDLQNENIRVGCWMCPAYNVDTGAFVKLSELGLTEPGGFTLEELAQHAVFDVVSARREGNTIDLIRAGVYLGEIVLINDLGGRFRAGRA